MEASNPFAQMPATPDSIIAQVRQQLKADHHGDLDARGTAWDPGVEDVVRDLWQGRVKTFIPVLALREARELLRDRGPVSATLPSEAAAPSMTSPTEPAVRDAMRLDNDVMTLNADDVLRL